MNILAASDLVSAATMLDQFAMLDQFEGEVASSSVCFLVSALLVTATRRAILHGSEHLIQLGIHGQ